MWGSSSQHLGQQNVENQLQKSTGSPPPDIFKNKHLSNKTEQRSVQSWDNEMWFSVVSDVWIPTQALKMQIHRCPMGPGIQGAVQEFWPLYVEWLLPARWKFVLFPWPGCFPHHSHLLLQLSQCHHSTHRHGCAIPCGSQLCNSQHGKSSSSSEEDRRMDVCQTQSQPYMMWKPLQIELSALWLLAECPLMTNKSKMR